MLGEGRLQEDYRQHMADYWQGTIWARNSMFLPIREIFRQIEIQSYNRSENYR